MSTIILTYALLGLLVAGADGWVNAEWVRPNVDDCSVPIRALSGLFAVGVLAAVWPFVILSWIAGWAKR